MVLKKALKVQTVPKNLFCFIVAVLFKLLEIFISTECTLQLYRAFPARVFKTPSHDSKLLMVSYYTSGDSKSSMSSLTCCLFNRKFN